MAWFQVDDQLAFHPKVVQAGNAAMGMWVRAGAWSQSHLTGGFIPVEQVRAFGGAALAKKLVSAGLWFAVDGGYQFHEWDKRQMSADEIRDRREKRAASGRKGGTASAATRRARAEAKRQANASANGEQVPKQNPTPVPVPTQEPSNEASFALSLSSPHSPPARLDIESEHPAATMILIPDDWAANDLHRAKFPRPDLPDLADGFRDHAIATGRRCRGRGGWDAAFSNWVRKSPPAAMPGVGAASTKAAGWLDIANAAAQQPNDQRAIR